jgi:hypothetical protein
MSILPASSMFAEFCPIFSTIQHWEKWRALSAKRSCFTWGPYVSLHKMAQRCHIDGSMIMFLNSKIYLFIKSSLEFNLNQQALRGVDSSLHYPVQSTNRLSQTECSSLILLRFWTFSRESLLFIFLKSEGKSIVPRQYWGHFCELFINYLNEWSATAVIWSVNKVFFRTK